MLSFLSSLSFIISIFLFFLILYRYADLSFVVRYYQNHCWIHQFFFYFLVLLLLLSVFFFVLALIFEFNFFFLPGPSFWLKSVCFVMEFFFLLCCIFLSTCLVVLEIHLCLFVLCFSLRCGDLHIIVFIFYFTSARGSLSMHKCKIPIFRLFWMR